jgi:hypothetical protein
MRTIDDLSYFYLDMLDQLDLAISPWSAFLGAWIAAEIAVKSTARMARLVMANAVGVKVGRSRDARHRRYFRADRAGISRHRLLRSECRPARLQSAAGRRSARRRARPRGDGAVCLESVFPQSAAQKPAASHPHPDVVPVGQSHDRMLSEAYGRAYCRNVPGARFETDRARRAFSPSGTAEGFAEKVLAFAKAK